VAEGIPWSEGLIDLISEKGVWEVIKKQKAV